MKSKLKIISPEDWPLVRDNMGDPTALVEYLVPTKAKTLLHGPPGAGKSALLWSIGNAVSTGQGIFNLRVRQASCLHISLDMNLYELRQRWGNSFLPAFPFVVADKVDITNINIFRTTELFATVRNHVEKHGTELVMIDAIDGLHLGHSAVEDTTANLVDDALSLWLPDCAVLMLGHNKKQILVDGKTKQPGPEDCLGSQMWSANATSQLNLVKHGRNISLLRHEKSQVLPRYPGPNIRLYINEHGQVELYDEHKQAGEIARFLEAKAILENETKGLSEKEKVKRFCEHLGGIGKTKYYELKKLASEQRIH
jgi:RecA-family ATPase